MEIGEIMKQIVEGNNLFMSQHSKEYFDSFKTEQKPYITLVTCSDSRVPLCALMPDTSNRIFSIQNIGNQILSTEGSVDYGIYHLKTPLLMFLGHSDCGAIKAYLKGFDNETYDIKHELDALKPMITEHINNLSFDELHAHTIEKNLDYQVSIACKKYKNLIVDGKLTVIGAFYDFREEFRKGTGTIVIVNINKHKDLNEIRQHPAFEKLTSEQINTHIARLAV